MFSLAEYRRKAQSLADFLPWAALIAPGVVLNKDGSFQRTASFRGPDLDSATPAELVGAASRLNNALRRLGSGWAIFVEANRNQAQDYPHSTFPDPVSALVDAERRAQFGRAVISRARITSPSFSCRPPRRPRALRRGCTKGAPVRRPLTRVRSSKVSSIAPTASWR